MSAPRTLQEKQDEKGRLGKAYRRAKREEWRSLCEQEPRLPAFRRALRKLDDPREILARLADSPLRTAAPNIRIATLRQIDRHANRMRLRQGGYELDDPLPPRSGIFHIARELLAVR